MLRIARYNRLLLYFLPLIAVGCDKATPPSFEGREQATHTIFELKSRCTSDHYPITTDIILCGNVTAADLYGEYYKMLIIEDNSGGISVAIDATELGDSYPVGCEVMIRCNGLTLCEYGGKIELGSLPDGYGAGRIPRNDLSRYLRRTATTASRRKPTVRRFKEITPQQIDTYVRFDNVCFTESGNWCTTDPESGKVATTEHPITDSDGNCFVVRVLASCIYANEPLPMGRGSLCGIIDYFNGHYSLRVVNHEAEFATFAMPPTTDLSTTGYSSPTPMR